MGSDFQNQTILLSPSSMLLLLFMAAIYLVAALCEVLFFLENCLAFGLSFEGLHSSSNIDNYFT